MKAIVAMIMAACTEVLAGPAPAPERVAAEPEPVVALAADGDRLYWATREAVRSAPAAGGEPALVAPVAGDGGELDQLLVVADTLVWSTELAIFAAPRAGGKARRLARAGRARIRAMASDGARVFWVQHPAPRGPGDGAWTRGGAVLGVAPATGRRWTVARRVEAPLDVAVAGGQVYWPSGMSIYRAAARGGGKAHRVVTDRAPRQPRDEVGKPALVPRINHLAIAGEHLYWRARETRRAPLAGGAPEPAPELTGLHGAGPEGFYQGRGDDLVVIAGATGQVTVLARGVGPVGAVAVGPGWIYFAARGALWRLPRP